MASTATEMIGSSRAPNSAMLIVRTERGGTVKPPNWPGCASRASVEKRRLATTGSSNGFVRISVSTLSSNV